MTTDTVKESMKQWLRSYGVTKRHLNFPQYYVPFLFGQYVSLGVFYYAFAALVIVGFGNAVNLTDGLDGLATMPVVIAAGGALNHRKARPAPMIPAHMMASSPAPSTCGMPR